MTNSEHRRGGKAHVNSLRELACDIQPTRDLWPDIAARLPGGERSVSSTRARLRAPWTQAVVAASIVILLGIGIWTGHGWRSREDARVSNVSAGSPMMLPTFHALDPHYLRERDQLLRSLPEQIAALPPESRTQVLESLATIHKAMRDIEAALGRDSSNALLQELLINTCQDEMRLLMAVHEAGAAGKRV